MSLTSWETWTWDRSAQTVLHPGSDTGQDHVASYCVVSAGHRPYFCWTNSLQCHPSLVTLLYLPLHITIHILFPPERLGGPSRFEEWTYKQKHLRPNHRPGMCNMVILPGSISHSGAVFFSQVRAILG